MNAEGSALGPGRSAGTSVRGTLGSGGQRFREHVDFLTSSRPSISRALQETPDAATHWSTRTLGRAVGISKSTVQRWSAPSANSA